MDFWTCESFRAVTAGRWLVPPVKADQPLAGITTDSRHVAPGQVFVAIRGEQHDGHAYLAEAAEKGAALLLVCEEGAISDNQHAIRRQGTETSRNQEANGSDNSTLDTRHSTQHPDPQSPVADHQTPITDHQSPAVLLVPDTVAALQQMARVWRDELRKAGCKVIAVTGSNGKTTTRHLIHAALSATMRGTQSPRSFNNHLGVPLTLLAASREDDFVVAEVGTNHPGEIAALAEIVRPDAAVVTNIGTAHIGHFGSQDAIAAEKSSLFRFLVPGGLAVANAQQAYIHQWRVEVIPAGVKVMTFGRRGALSATDEAPSRTVGAPSSAGAGRSFAAPKDPPCRDGAPDLYADGPITIDDTGLHFTIDGGQRVHLRFLGMHNVDNALAALCVSRHFGVPDAQAAAALSAATGVEMRMQVVRIGDGREGTKARRQEGTKGTVHRDSGRRTQDAGRRTQDPGLTVINDAYNANPDSMASALSTLATLPLRDPAARRVAILGDMFELGEDTVYEHRHVGDLLCVFNDLKPRPPGPPRQPAHRQARPTRIGLVILIGTHMRHAAEQLARVWPEDAFVHYDQWTDDLPQRVAALLRDGDVVLLKASRGIRLERLLPAIEQRFAPQLEPSTLRSGSHR
jgi:UDP-N-acetylmuramoyl-tripeptide--D-alanyl-D-alanine ligase